MSDDSNLWEDDDDIDWQDIASYVIEEAPNITPASTTTTRETSAHHASNDLAESVEKGSSRERAIEISSDSPTNQQTVNETGGVEPGAPATSEPRDGVGQQQASEDDSKGNHSLNIVAQTSRDAQQQQQQQQKEARKRSILAALEEDSSGEEDHKETKKRRRGSRTSDDAKAGKGPEIPTSSQTITLSQGVRALGALSAYDDELSCPICLDLFLAPQLLNPCGHSVCGDCIIHWIDRNRDDPTCPSCRAEISPATPYIHNLAIDNTVEKHIEILRKNKDSEWNEGGIKWKEREVRKRTYEALKATKPDSSKSTQRSYPWPLGSLVHAAGLLDEFEDGCIKAESNEKLTQVYTETQIVDAIIGKGRFLEPLYPEEEPDERK
ncbi:hypothetical protein FRC17_002526 [Serendipita sp. 399]|nr:hypothetical protein FRC17_002526 [Serendipita sp. 399]